MAIEGRVRCTWPLNARWATQLSAAIATATTLHCLYRPAILQTWPLTACCAVHYRAVVALATAPHWLTSVGRPAPPPLSWYFPPMWTMGLKFTKLLKWKYFPSLMIREIFSPRNFLSYKMPLGIIKVPEVGSWSRNRLHSISRPSMSNVTHVKGVLYFICRLPLLTINHATYRVMQFILLLNLNFMHNLFLIIR